MINDLKPYPAMKDSGMPWLGEVPEHWEVQRIKTLFREKEERSGDGSGLLLSLTRARGLLPQAEASNRIASASDLSKYKVCRPGELVMNRMQAWSGMFAASEHKGLVSPDYCVFEATEALELRFFEQVFKTPVVVDQFAKASKGIGSGFNRLYTPDFGAIPVAFPRLHEQAAIVRFLDHADRKIRRYIRAKQKLIKLLEEQKQAIIHRAVTRGLDPNVRLKPSGVEWLGDVPEHWEVKRLHQVTDPNRSIMYGIVLPGPNVDDGVYIIKGGNCEPGRLRPELLSRTTFDIEARYTRSRLVGRDIVFAIRGGVGAAELVPQEIAGANLTQDAARIAAGSGIDPHWLLHAVRAPIFQEHVQSQVVGATVRGINIRDLKRIELAVPPSEEQPQIVAFLGDATEDIDAAMGRALCEVDLLHEYRTRLIADVVTGKLDVREAAAGLPEEEPVADEALSEPYDQEDAEDSPEYESFPSEEE